MCLSLLQALPYVALLIVMLFFIYAVIGMQVSCYFVPLFSPLCLDFFSLLPFSKPSSCVCPSGVLFGPVPVQPHHPSLLQFSSCSSYWYLVIVCLCLSTSSLSLSLCRLNSCCIVCVMMMSGRHFDLICWGQQASNSDWLPLINTDIVCYVLLLLPSPLCRCLVR